MLIYGLVAEGGGSGMISPERYQTIIKSNVTITVGLVLQMCAHHCNCANQICALIAAIIWTLFLIFNDHEFNV